MVAAWRLAIRQTSQVRGTITRVCCGGRLEARNTLVEVGLGKGKGGY